MSRKNVEIVRQALDALNRGDLDAALRNSVPDVEVDWSRSRGFQTGIYRGRQAVRDFWSGLGEMFDVMTVSPEEFIEVGEYVLVPNRVRWRGREGIELDTRSTVVVSFRGSRIVRWQLYQERAEALEAVGPEE